MTLNQLRESMILVDSYGEWWEAQSEEGQWWLRSTDDRDLCVDTDGDLAGFRPFLPLS